jgi:hypothetical protein
VGGSVGAMSRSERTKGRAGEAEARALFASHGFQADALQRNLGDELDTLVTGYGWCFGVEVKRCNVLRIPEWTRQAEAGAPAGFLPMVAYRRDREPWYVVTRLDPLLAMLAENGRMTADQVRRRAAADINIAALREELARYEDAYNTLDEGIQRLTIPDAAG